MCNGTYTNILKDHFERKLIYPLIERKSSTYFRYNDDIFLIWTGTNNKLYQFFKDSNNKKHPSIKFDYKALKNRITFLDTEIYLHNGKLHTIIYRKESDRQCYLQIKFKHPKPLKDSLSDSQAILIKRIS